MDLQAILDQESDDSDSYGNNNHIKPTITTSRHHHQSRSSHSRHFINTSGSSSSSSNSCNVDLEEILREDDSDSEERDVLSDDIYHHHHYSRSSAALSPLHQADVDYRTKNNHHHPTNNNIQHSSEEWALLQTILGEGDDDDDTGGDNHDDDSDDDEDSFPNPMDSMFPPPWLAAAAPEEDKSSHNKKNILSSSAAKSKQQQRQLERDQLEELLKSPDHTSCSFSFHNDDDDEGLDFSMPPSIVSNDIIMNVNNHQASSASEHHIAAENIHAVLSTGELPLVPESTTSTSQPGGVSSSSEKLAIIDKASSSRSSPHRNHNKNKSSSGSRQHNYGAGLLLSSKKKQNQVFDEGVITRRALSYAQSHSRKLLKAGRREIVSPLMVKRRLRPKVELTARSTSSNHHNNIDGDNESVIEETNHNNNKQQRHQYHSAMTSSTTNSRLSLSSSSSAGITTVTTTARFHFSGSMVQDKEMSTVSTQLQKHSDESQAKVFCGLPTCMACNSKFITVGTQLGIILVFDLFEVLRQRLGGGGFEDNWNARKAGAVTSLDLNANGEMIVAGYTSGMLVLWDTIRGTVLKTMNDTHPSPITSTRFLGNSLKTVSCDAGGLVNRLTFVKGLLWSSYSVETDCLLDGTAGQILAMDVLPPMDHHAMVTINNSNNKQNAELVANMKSITLIALSSERSSFVVAVEPTVNVLHRWSRPSQERVMMMQDTHQTRSFSSQDRVDMPCLAWGWALVSGGGNVATPILARAWGCCLEFLSASFPAANSDETTTGEGNGTNAAAATGADKSSSADSMQWPGFGIRDEVDTTVPIVAIEWLNNRSLMYLTATNEFHLVDTVMMTLLERLDFSGLKLVYAEFALSRSASAAGTGTRDNEVKQTSTTTFQNSMRYNDDRLLILCQDKLKAISILGAKSRVASLEEDGEWLEALALALDHYDSTVVSQEDRRRDPLGRRNLAKHPEFATLKNDDDEWIAKLLIRYINLAVENAPEQMLDMPGATQSRIDLVKSHYQMLAGVCVEFCVVTRRLDLLYGPIFRTFQQVGFVAVFLDVLEPYVLNDKLSYMAPEVMSQFVEKCKAADDIATVERCLLHMDCTIMDFDSILSLLRTNEMYTALFFVFNQGLDDFVTPLEILLERVFDEADTGSPALPRRRNGVPQNDFERYGYKAILYLQMCFKGRTFPLEEEHLPEDRLATVGRELVIFLITKEYKPSPHAKRSGDRMFVIGTRASACPYLSLLIQVDPRGVFETLSLAFDSPHFVSQPPLGAESGDGWENESNGQVIKIQEVIDSLVDILIPSESSESRDGVVPQSAVDVFLDFVGKYLMGGTVTLHNRIIFMVLTRAAELYSKANSAEDRYQKQKRVLDLLGALPSEAYDPDDVLALIQKFSIHRAALLLHQQVASSWYVSAAVDSTLRYHHFRSAIDCYLDDDDVEFRKEVFHYAKKECAGTSTPRHGEQPKTLRDALREKLPDLVRLDAEMAVRLVAELFVEEFEDIVAELDTGDEGTTQFAFLQAIISGNLAETDPAAVSVLPVTMDHHHTYLELMVSHHPSLVYEYLSAHNNYRASDALRLCQSHDIADATAYLLEKMGNVSSALQLILQTLESRMMSLKRTVRGMSVDVFRQRKVALLARKPSTDSLSKQEKDAEDVKRILIVALDVCSRNSGTTTTRSEQGSQLWFNVLDRLINAKGFLRLSKEQPEHAREMGNVLSDLLRTTMQRMVSSVPLTDLVRKVTADHSGSQLGELREMLDSLLDTYGFELKVSQEAHRALLQDVRDMKKRTLDLQQQGSIVQGVMNISISSPDEVSNLLRESRHHQVLSVQNNGNSTFLDGASGQSTAVSVNRLESALDRLRQHRGRKSRRGGATTTTMMSKTERLYVLGELEPVTGDHFVGVLGDAESRGSLMML